MASKISTEIYKDTKGEFRWRKTAGKELVGKSSEGYKARKDCEANATRRSVKDQWKFYKDNGGKHRWRRTAVNGQIVGSSHRSFASRADANKNATANGMKI